MFLPLRNSGDDNLAVSPRTNISNNNGNQESTKEPRFLRALKVELRVKDITHPGAARFLNTIFIAGFVKTAVPTVWHVLYGNPHNKANNVRAPTLRHLKFVLRDFDGIGTSERFQPRAAAWEVCLSVSYILSIPHERLYDEIVGVLLRQTSLCFQHDGKSTAPRGLIDGMADYVRLKCGYAPPQWQENPPSRWDLGGPDTAYFLRHLEKVYGFGTVKRINSKLKDESYVEATF